MRCRTGPLFSLTLTLLAAAGCADRQGDDLAGPVLSTAAGYATISGRVLDGSGNSICDLPGAPGEIGVTALTPNLITGFGTTVACPGDVFDIVVPDPGAYLLRVNPRGLPPTSGIPAFFLDPAVLTVDDGDVQHDVFLQDGVALGGGAWLYGAPLPGLPLAFLYAGAPAANTTAGSAASAASGAWSQFAGQRPAILQPGARYLVRGCERLGHTSVGFPRGPFLFPDAVGAIDCRLEVGPTARFTHQRSRLAMTPFPADIGGLSASNELDRYGLGFGVQFPVDQLTYGGDDWLANARTASQLYRGGLIVGVGDGETGVVLTGFDIGGYGVGCGAACRDLGLDGTLAGPPAARPPSAANPVLWQYSDAGSRDAVGLKVDQRSYDPASAGDYVLVEFTFQNRRSGSLTFWAGFWGDWDIDDDPYDDAAYVYFTDRPLLVQTNQGSVGSHLGTMLLGDAPPAGYTVYADAETEPRTIAWQLARLRGDQRSTFTVGDTRSISSLGPITLTRNGKASVWLVIAAGEDETGLLANVALARADVAARRARE